MNVSTLPRYLVGSREAILKVAGSRWSWLIGMIFVLSAGLAREYDGEDLVHEPWHALRPLGASLVTGSLLFLIVHWVAVARSGLQTPPPFFKSWRTFLGLFWMTAPMAWLYAIPYERWMSPVDAITFNLWTLAVVAIWRVVLMIRVVCVVYGFRLLSSTALMLLFADIVLFAFVAMAPKPVIDVMGGIRHSERDALIANITFTTLALSVLAGPVVFVCASIAASLSRPKFAELTDVATGKLPRGLLWLAIGSVLAFTPLLILSQPEQMNRRSAERMLKSGQVAEALALMSAEGQDAFPPQWDPPPQIGFRETEPSLADIRDAILADPPADWVTAIYVGKISRRLQTDAATYWARSWEEIYLALEPDPADIIRLQFDKESRLNAEFLVSQTVGMSDIERDSLAGILKMLEAHPPTTQPDLNDTTD